MWKPKHNKLSLIKQSINMKRRAQSKKRENTYWLHQLSSHAFGKTESPNKSFSPPLFSRCNDEKQWKPKTKPEKRKQTHKNKTKQNRGKNSYLIQAQIVRWEHDWLFWSGNKGYIYTVWRYENAALCVRATSRRQYDDLPFRPVCWRRCPVTRRQAREAWCQLLLPLHRLHQLPEQLHRPRGARWRKVAKWPSVELVAPVRPSERFRLLKGKRRAKKKDCQ